MATLDENKVLGGPDLDTSETARIVDACVADPIGFVKELMESSPGGMWAQRVCAMLLYLMHKANGDDGLAIGVSDDFATQDNGSILRTVGTSVLLRDAGDAAYRVFRPASMIYGSFGQFDVPVNGSPEGVLSAVPGSTARDTGGGASTTLYVKESGTGNTGWVAK